MASASRLLRRWHSNAVAAFCWESGDNTTADWYPQGITTTADASANGQYEGKIVVLASWYYSGSRTEHDHLGAGRGEPRRVVV